MKDDEILHPYGKIKANIEADHSFLQNMMCKPRGLNILGLEQVGEG